MIRKPRKLKPEERRVLAWVQDLVLLNIRDAAAARELTKGEPLNGHYNAKIEALKRIGGDVEAVANGIEPMRRT